MASSTDSDVKLADRIMKLAVIGATGPTGQLLVNQALDKGHQVVAIVRSPEKLKVKHDRLVIAKVDIFDEKALAEAITHCDAVISCLGATPTLFEEITLHSESTKILVAAMKKARVKRLIFISSWYNNEDNSSQYPWYMRFLVKPLLIGRNLDDMARTEQYLDKECPDIDFTSVRPPGLNNSKMDGRDLLAEPDVDFATNMSTFLPRADLARFMIQITEENAWIRKCITVGLPA